MRFSTSMRDRSTSSDYIAAASHLVTCKAITPQNVLQRYKHTSGPLVERAESVLRDWDIAQGPLTVLASPILTSTLKTRSSWAGCYPRICEDEKSLAGFKFISVEEFGSMQLKDANGVVQAYRFKVPNEVVTSLASATDTLPSLDRSKATSGSSNPIARGAFDQRHYAVWGDYGNKPAYSKELRKDGAVGLSWIEATCPATNFINQLFQLEMPEVYAKGTNTELQKLLRQQPVKDPLMPSPLVSPFEAFHGVCINRGITDGDSNVHFDRLDDHNTHNLVIPFGAFGGAHLILWQLRVIVEVPPCWGLSFTGSLIAHSLTKVTGVRNSVDYFIHKALYNWAKKQLAANPFAGKNRKAAANYGTKKSMRKQKTAAKVQKKRKEKKGGMTETRKRQKGVINAEPGSPHNRNLIWNYGPLIHLLSCCIGSIGNTQVRLKRHNSHTSIPTPHDMQNISDAGSCNQCSCPEFAPRTDDKLRCADDSCGHQKRFHASKIPKTITGTRHRQERGNTTSSDTDLEIQRKSLSVHTSTHLHPAANHIASPVPVLDYEEVRQANRGARSSLPAKGDSRSGRKSVNEERYEQGLRRRSTTGLAEASAPMLKVSIRIFTKDAASLPTYLPGEQVFTWNRTDTVENYQDWLASLYKRHHAWAKDRKPYIYLDDKPLRGGSLREVSLSSIFRPPLTQKGAAVVPSEISELLPREPAGISHIFTVLKEHAFSQVPGDTVVTTPSGKAKPPVVKRDSDVVVTITIPTYTNFEEMDEEEQERQDREDSSTRSTSRARTTSVSRSLSTTRKMSATPSRTPARTPARTLPSPKRIIPTKPTRTPARKTKAKQMDPIEEVNSRSPSGSVKGEGTERKGEDTDKDSKQPLPNEEESDGKKHEASVELPIEVSNQTPIGYYPPSTDSSFSSTFAQLSTASIVHYNHKNRTFRKGEDNRRSSSYHPKSPSFVTWDDEERKNQSSPAEETEKDDEEEEIDDEREDDRGQRTTPERKKRKSTAVSPENKTEEKAWKDRRKSMP
ncbi:hypothetical protein BJ508DRAFT_303291 [Ascobolus immersus RN42]|uniref:Uncharacterized protein n=1 Tax=Ascobolus immersus RN42 TaxID=1160509 RepID=A0A3N4IFI5_ASCIM|nr:hypothetical protein BJ508DRAFT_313719 [Ascobolus immersus RN42]RPA84895.1 hypothetical protein BJ508DRAFT_303291 [Ascobolus immersus RN42]